MYYNKASEMYPVHLSASYKEGGEGFLLVSFHN